MNELKKGLMSIVLSSGLFVSGCSMGDMMGITHSGFEHTDMSKSPYSNTIKAQADELIKTPKDEKDYQTAAELYGSIGEVERMDEAAKKYFEKNPRQGLLLLGSCDKVRKFYGK